MLQSESVCFFQDQRQTRVQLSGTWALGSIVLVAAKTWRMSSCSTRAPWREGAGSAPGGGVLTWSSSPTLHTPDQEMRNAGLEERCDLAELGMGHSLLESRSKSWAIWRGHVSTLWAAFLDEPPGDGQHELHAIWGAILDTQSSWIFRGPKP